jgi:hypothetical protein
MECSSFFSILNICVLKLNLIATDSADNGCFKEHCPRPNRAFTQLLVRNLAKLYLVEYPRIEVITYPLVCGLRELTKKRL